MKRNGRFMAGSVCALAAYLLGAGWMAPFDAAQQHRKHPFVAPMRLVWTPMPSYCELISSATGSGSVEDCTRLHRLRFLVAGKLFAGDPEAPYFLIGSDELGRDQWSRLLYGGRITLAAGVSAAVMTLLIGLLIGMWAGYQGGWMDDALMGISALVLACPWIYLLLGIRAFLPLSLPPEQSFFLIVWVTSAVGWPRTARLIRGLVQSLRERDHVLAARGFGASGWHIMRVHLMPEIRNALLAQFAILAPQFILAEVTLSFVGLGIAEPGVSWGTMLAGLRNVSALLSHAWLTLPCVPVAVTFVYFQWMARRMQYTERS